MSKSIFIIGANSALAKAAVPVLAKDNTITTAGKKDCDVYCDITESVSIPKGIDTVISFAAAFGGDSDEEIINAERTNVLGILNICAAAKKAGVKHIINISSIFALLDKKSPYYSIYALTKKQGDEVAELYCQVNKIPLTIIRPAQIYGDSDSFANHQPFFYSMIDKAQNGEDISIYGKNDALRNYIHSADLAEVINRVTTERIEGVYSCMFPSDVTYSQVAHAAQEVFNKGGQIIFLKDKPDIPDNIFTKDLTIYEKVNYPPQISLEEGIKRIKEYRQGGSK